jgi:hypothetical protein
MLLIFIYFHSWSQQPESKLNNLVPEKIYLQLDSKVYASDKIIWFKSVVTNAIDHTPTSISGVLYVELINPNERILEKKLIKLEKGIGDGYFQLSQPAMEGTYLIRAYTEWNKNFGPDFFFKEYIKIFSPSSKTNKAISKITLIEKEDHKRSLQTFFDPKTIDSGHSKKIRIIISQKDKKDTLFIKKNKNDEFILDYDLEDSSQFVTLQLETKNLFSESKTITLNEDFLDLQFFPESGQLVHGIKSRVAFKAIDSKGKGKQVSGEIVDKMGQMITPFESNALGMGYFTLMQVDSSDSYSAKLSIQDTENTSQTYPLPRVTALGNVMWVIGKENVIRGMASSNYLKNDSIYIKASCRGQVYFDIKGRLSSGKLLFSLPANKLPEGIIAFTMMDTPGHIVAERLFFNEQQDQRIQIDLSIDKRNYYQRDLTKLTINATNKEGHAVDANLSVLAFNKGQLSELQNDREHILSYFLLSSDLKGNIENPSFYFGNNPNRRQHLDVLMLTQGWRRYQYYKTLDSIAYHPERALSVAGSVKEAKSHLEKKAVDLTLLTFGSPKSLQAQTTNDLGKFDFQLDDEYGDPLKILIQSNNQSGKKKNYTIDLEKANSPPVDYDIINVISEVDSTVQLIVKNNIERKILEDSYRLSNGITQLNEVVLKPYEMTPQRQEVADNYGKPTFVVEGKEIHEKEKKWSYGLYSILLFNYPEKVTIVQDGPNMYARVVGAPSFGPGDGVTLVVVDGVPVLEQDYQLIPSIPPSEVKSFEIIQSARKFRQLYLLADPTAPIIDVPSIGSVIAIYTYAGKGIHGVQKAKGIINTTVPVFSKSIEFYEPKYENLSPKDWQKPDLRSIIHWDPSINIDSKEQVSTSFYNADISGKVRIVVEAISNDGAIGYEFIDYAVEKR